MPGRQAGFTGTRAAVVAGTRGADPRINRAMARLAGAGLRDLVSDAEARRRAGVEQDGVLPERIRAADNLPMVVNRAIVQSGGRFQPTWHQVRHLPGYLSNPIRALGRQVFAQFTDVPIERISVLCTITNPETEVRAMMAWIARNGIRDDQAKIWMRALLPDERINVQIWNSQEHTFCLVHDLGGFYVYGWPGGRGVALETRPQPGRIAEPRQ